MALPKRITKSRVVYSRVDPAIAKFSDLEKHMQYCRTLDINDLGDLTKLLEQPTAITIAPLKTKWAHLDKGESFDASDCWLICSTHIEKIDGMTLTWENEKAGVLHESVREMLTEDVLFDIAQMVIQLANGDGANIPFYVAGILRENIKAQKNSVSRPVKRAVVSSGDATSKE